MWNHRDARSKCDKLCALNFPGKNATFNGNWSIKRNGAQCGCSFEAKHQTAFVGCPSFKSLGSKDCFMWNDSEAQENCQRMCDKFLLNKGSKWTGKWKNTSANTSACECSFYD
jgi:hypothetical protein